MKRPILIISVIFCALSITVMPCIAQQHSGQHRQEEKAPGKKKIKYYTCGMHPSVRVSTEEYNKGKVNCPICNMKLIPVYEEEGALSASKGEEEGVIKLSQRDISLAGIESESVVFRHLFKEIRTVGVIAYDPELYKAEEEFIQAINTQNDLKKSDLLRLTEMGKSLVEASRLKLRIQGLSEEQIDELSKQKQPDRSLIISDALSPYVWVYADIYEYELSWIKIRQPVKATSVSFPGEEFTGRIEAIDPILNPMTRSVRIRAKIDNLQLKLKPQMYVDILIESYPIDDSEQHKPVLAVPRDAVLDTGVRKIVYIDLGNGSFLGREVKTGPEAVAYADGQKRKFFPVVSGLEEGDLVVTRANFLIDSQSQLTGAASAYGGALGVKEEARPSAHQH